MYVLILVTGVLIVILYFFGVQKTLTPDMEWKSFKINTKLFVILISVYALVIYLLYKK